LNDSNGVTANKDTESASHHRLTPQAVEVLKSTDAAARLVAAAAAGVHRQITLDPLVWHHYPLYSIHTVTQPTRVQTDSIGNAGGNALTLWHSLLPYGYSYKASCARPCKAVICNFWQEGILTLRA